VEQFSPFGTSLETAVREFKANFGIVPNVPAPIAVDEFLRQTALSAQSEPYEPEVARVAYKNLTNSLQRLNGRLSKCVELLDDNQNQKYLDAYIAGKGFFGVESNWTTYRRRLEDNYNKAAARFAEALQAYNTFTKMNTYRPKEPSEAPSVHARLTQDGAGMKAAAQLVSLRNNAKGLVLFPVQPQLESAPSMAYPPGSSAMAYPPGSSSMAYPPGSSAMAYPPGSSSMAYPPGSSSMAYPPGSSASIPNLPNRRASVSSQRVPTASAPLQPMMRGLTRDAYNEMAAALKEVPKVARRTDRAGDFELQTRLNPTRPDKPEKQSPQYKAIISALRELNVDLRDCADLVSRNATLSDAYLEGYHKSLMSQISRREAGYRPFTGTAKEEFDANRIKLESSYNTALGSYATAIQAINTFVARKNSSRRGLEKFRAESAQLTAEMTTLSNSLSEAQVTGVTIEGLRSVASSRRSSAPSRAPSRRRDEATGSRVNVAGASTSQANVAGLSLSRNLAGGSTSRVTLPPGSTPRTNTSEFLTFKKVRAPGKRF
jgi:hypothetical protein